MTLLIKCIVILFLSFGFVFVRTMNVKAVAGGRVIASTLWGVLVSIMWLLSIYLGISSLIADQWVIFIPYATGGAIGNVLAMYYKHTQDDRRAALNEHAKIAQGQDHKERPIPYRTGSKRNDVVQTASGN